MDAFPKEWPSYPYATPQFFQLVILGTLTVWSAPGGFTRRNSRLTNLAALFSRIADSPALRFIPFHALLGTGYAVFSIDGYPYYASTTIKNQDLN